MKTDINILEVSKITRSFGGLIAVDTLSLSVRPGSIHGLIGPNGAGKTTLLNLIAAFHKPTSGIIKYRGIDITSDSAEKRARNGIRRTFQNLKLFHEMTALENVAVGLYPKSSAGVFDALLNSKRHLKEEERIRETAASILKFVGLAEAASVIAGKLPYGHRRLLEIARAIASEPELLLLDEPAAGLNAAESKKLSDLILEIRSKGTTIILVEHHMDVVMTVCDSLTVLNYGRKLAEGTPLEIQSNPDVIEAYLGRT